MNTSPTEEHLLLYYYDEGLSPDERSDISAVLRAEPKAAARYEELCAFLERANDASCGTASDRQHDRWHSAIDHAARAEHGRSDGINRRAPTFAWGIAATMLLAIGAAIGFGLRGPVPANDPADRQVQAEHQRLAARRAAFGRGLRDHFRSSQLGVFEIDATSSDARQAFAQRIVWENRLLERVAEHLNAEELARLLRALEPVLLELGAPETSAVRAQRLKNQLDFELSVMVTKMAPANSTDTETI